MANEKPTNDSEETARNIKRFLEVLGALLAATAGQPMIAAWSSSPSVFNRVEFAICVLGATLMCIGFFWKPKPALGSTFMLTLGKISSDARSYVAMVFLAWLYMAVLTLLTQVRQNNEIVALRNDEQSMARVMDRAILPRHLTKLQQSEIISFLSRFGPHEYEFRVDDNDSEAFAYWIDIEVALVKAGWKRSKTFTTYKDIAPGLQITSIRTPASLQTPPDPKEPDPGILLRMAFGQAGVRLEGVGSGTGGDVTEDRLVISVGRRRMDSYELTPALGPPY